MGKSQVCMPNIRGGIQLVQPDLPKPVEEIAGGFKGEREKKQERGLQCGSSSLLFHSSF